MLIILFSKQRKSFHLSFNAKKEGFFVIKEVLFVRVSEINSRARISFSDRKQTESKERKKKTFFLSISVRLFLSLPSVFLCLFFLSFSNNAMQLRMLSASEHKKGGKGRIENGRNLFFFLAFLRFLRQTRD